MGRLDSPTGLYSDTVTQRDMWASFDGGYTWAQCATAGTAWIRGEQGATVNRAGLLVLVGGYAYAENGGQQVRYNDVWRSTFSVDNSTALAMRCGGLSRLPSAGVGLRVWPGRPVVPSNTLTFTAVTLRAPWSSRLEARAPAHVGARDLQDHGRDDGLYWQGLADVSTRECPTWPAHRNLTRTTSMARPTTAPHGSC